MAKDPAVLFYTGDFLVGVSDMPFLERGYYITLLCMQHQKGHLSEETICFALGLRSVSEIPSVMSHFKIDDDGKYYQGRMEEETVKRSKYTESRKQNGLNGGRPRGSKNSREEQISDWDEMLNFFGNKCIKCGCEFTKPERPTKDHIIPKSWGGNDDICNLQPLCRECNASKCADNKDDYRINYISDIPPHLKKKWIKSENHMVLLQKPYENHMGNGNDNENKDVNSNKKRGSGGKDFDAFWTAYPKKVGKQAAKKAFEKTNVNIGVLVDAVKKQKESSQWLKDGGQYIPNPATWLNQGRWEDELTTPQRHKSFAELAAEMESQYDA